METKHDSDDHGGQLEECKRIGRVLDLLYLLMVQPRHWTRAALATRYELSERQIAKDLDLLKHGLKCAIRSARGIGYYLERQPDLPAIRYTAAEALALLTALRLAQHSGSVEAASLAAALARTESALPAEFLGLLRAVRVAAARQSTQSGHRAAMLARVQGALTEGRCLRVVYESASSGGVRTERVWQPYHLWPDGVSWLVAAHDSLRDDVLTFRVDRLVTAEVTADRYTIPADFDPEQYCGGGWGVLRGICGPEQEVVVRFSAEEGRRARDEEHHPSQQTEILPDGRVEMRFQVAITSELLRWLFKWGDGCEVLAPPELRAQVAERAQNIAARHAAPAPQPPDTPR